MFLWIILAYADAYPIITIGSHSRHIQLSEWSIFELEYDESISSVGSLRFTLEFEFLPSLVLSLNKNTEPRFDSKKEQVEADYVDYNSWKTSKLKHIITLPSEYFNSSAPIYLGVGSPELLVFVSFSLTTEYSNGSLCPNDCSGNGNCLLYECECNDFYIDVDCGVNGYLLKKGNWYHFEVLSLKYAYFWIESYDFYVEFSWTQGTSIVSIDWEEHLYIELPTLQEYYIQVSLNSDSNYKQVTVRTEAIEASKLYFAIFNTSPTSSLSLSMRISEEEEPANLNAILYILIGVSCFILLIWMIGGLIKCKLYQRSNQVIQQPERVVGFSREALDKMCPKVLFKDVDGNEAICTICLEEFREKDSVRQLSCGHVFHSTCIEEWFANHKKCCLCKRDCTPRGDNDLTFERDITRNNVLDMSNNNE